MSFNIIFSKSLKTIPKDFKATANQMISNSCDFSCQCVTISFTREDEIIYPSSDNVSEWMKNFMEVELKPKPLNAKALEEMAKKGIKPRKQITDIILVCITPSNTHIHIGVSIPSNMNIDVKDFIDDAISNYNYNFSKNDNFGYANITHSESFKERDNVLRCFFNELKKRKIYVDEDEEEVLNYLD